MRGIPVFLLFVVLNKAKGLHYVDFWLCPGLIERLVGGIGAVDEELVFLRRQVVETEVDRIDRVAFVMYFVVEVRGSGKTRIADLADFMAFFHLFAYAFCYALSA